MKSGTISEDFPLPHNKFVPTFKNPKEKKYRHKIAKTNNIYTNEHPDLFRLDGMKEGGYVNPFMNRIIKVDRNEYFKKLSLDRKNINFIDFLKTSRNYSQNQKILRYINNDRDNELRKKRMGKKTKNLSYSEINSNYNNIYNKNILLTEENKNKIKNEYNIFIKKLNSYVPKIDYRIKRTLEISDEDYKIDANNLTSENNIDNNLYKKFINKNNTYIYNLKNMNNYKISTSLNENNEDEFIFKRKKVNQFNPIRDRRDVIEVPPYKNGKWSPFLENYFLTANSRKKFLRKGGLLTEFCNKNITSIKKEKNKIIQKMKEQNKNLFEKNNKLSLKYK